MNYLFSPEEIKVSNQKDDVAGYDAGTRGCGRRCIWGCHRGCLFSCHRMCDRSCKGRCIASCRRRTLW